MVSSVLVRVLLRSNDVLARGVVRLPSCRLLAGIYVVTSVETVEERIVFSGSLNCFPPEFGPNVDHTARCLVACIFMVQNNCGVCWCFLSYYSVCVFLLVKYSCLPRRQYHQQRKIANTNPDYKTKILRSSIAAINMTTTKKMLIRARR